MSSDRGSKIEGHLLLVESKNMGKLSASALKEAKQQAFRKLHIVEIQDLSQKRQKFEFIDQLTFTDQTTKLIEYDSERGIIFLINLEKVERQITLYTIKLKKEFSEDSESDDARSLSTHIKFEYITETRLQIGNECFSGIQKTLQAN